LEFVDAINKIHFPEEYKSKLKSKLELEMKNLRLPFPEDYYKRK
jgi:hypothetical protein